MPSILVVEHEGRYIERIQDALSAEGWRPRFVAGRPEALRAAASEAPNLVLVNAELPGAAELLRTFARSAGGPGSVALLGEGGSGEGLVADEILAKPFSDQELRLVVRRRLTAAEKGGSPPPPRPASTAVADDDHKLTSQEIFGDLLAEVEKETATDEPESAAPVASPAAEPVAQAVSLDEDDIERRLERTLSGVPGLSRRHRASSPPTTGSPVAPPPPRREPPTPEREEPERQEPPSPHSPEPPQRDPEPAEPPRGDPPTRRPERSLRRTDDDVDELLNMTLSGLALGSRGGTRRAAASTAPAGAGVPAEKAPPAKSRTAEIDFAELEALAGRTRRGGRSVADREAVSGKAAGEARGDAPPAVTGPDAAGGETPTVEASKASAAPTVESASPPPPPPDDPPAIPAAATAPGPGAPVEVATAGEDDGRRFGHYRLLERIAVGGMAEVWKARMSGVEGFQKTVAIKRILPHMNDDSDFVDMFIDEAKLAAQLNHPNITHIYDLGKIGDDYYIAMEYVDGRNLRAILNESRRKALKLPVGFALVVAARLASALDYAHRKRDFDDRDLELVHRDVSPQNVLISTDGDIKLCDFGISKAVAKLNQTETGALKGKLQYMSPEQAWGRKVDARSDLFSLGALIFEMLTGERLFTGDSEISVLEAVRECRVRRPRQVEANVPAAVEAVVLKALEREPADRYANAGEMLQAIEQVLYQLRPTPSQADVATFLTRLEAAAEVRPGALVPPPGDGTGAGPIDAADPAEAGDTGTPATGSGATTAEEAEVAADFSSPSPGGAPPPADSPAKLGEDLDEDAEGPTATGSRSGWEASALPAAAAPPAGDARVPGMSDPAVAGAEPTRPVGAPAPPPGASPPLAGETGRRWWRFGSEAPAAGPPPTSPGSSTGSDPDATGERTGTATDRREATQDRRSAQRPAARAKKELTQTGVDQPAPPSPGTAGGTTSSPSAPAPSTTGTPATEATATGTGTPALPAIAARGELEEDDAGRGRWLLVAAILLVAVLSVAAWIWFDRPGRGGATGTPATVEEPSAADPVVTTPVDPPVADESPTDTAAPQIDLEKLVEEELARQEDEVRRKAEEDYRETARRIQAEIDALNRRQPTPPPPAEEQSTPPPGASEPPAPTGVPQSSATIGPARSVVDPDRLVSSGEEQYPARTRGPWIERPSARSSTDRRG